jgi:hypothetical protein
MEGLVAISLLGGRKDPGGAPGTPVGGGGADVKAKLFFRHHRKRSKIPPAMRYRLSIMHTPFE